MQKAKIGPMTPGEVRQTLEAMSRVEPFDMSQDERAAADAWERKLEEFSKLNADKGIEDVFR